MQENCRASAWGPAKKHALCCDCSDLFLNNPAVGTFKCHRAQDAGAIGTGIKADATGEFDTFFKDRMAVHNGHDRDDERTDSAGFAQNFLEDPAQLAAAMLNSHHAGTTEIARTDVC